MGGSAASRRANRSRTGRLGDCTLLILCLLFLLPKFLVGQTKPAASTPPAKSKASSPARKPGQTAAPRPSLDLLVQRVESYWNLLAQSKKLQALNFVAPSYREYFAARPFPTFSRPRITTLEPSGSGKEVAVTVTVKRRIYPLPAEVDYPVMNRWIYSAGNWYVIIKDEPLFSPTAERQGEKLSAEEIEKRKAEIRSALRFEQHEIDFGTVRQGQTASFTLDYQLNGSQSFDASVSRAPQALTEIPDRRLLPGGAQKIGLSLLTSNYEGPVEEHFSIVVKHADVEVTYDFLLRGRVYAPLSAAPSILRFLKTENEKKVEIRNNSSASAEISSIFSESGRYTVDPLPQMLEPGQQCEVTVRIREAAEGANHAEQLVLLLDKPVDGLQSLPLRVILNYDPAQEKRFGGLSAKDIEDLLRKARPDSPKPE